MKKPKDPLYGGGARFGGSPPPGVVYEHSQKADLRNDLAKARDAFMADDREGGRLADWRTMKYLREDAAQYLYNRIQAAFVAGWDAHERHTSGKGADHG